MCPEQGPEHKEGTEVKHTVFLWSGTVKNGDSPLICYFCSPLHSYWRISCGQISGQTRRVHILTHIPRDLCSSHPLCSGFVTIKASHHPTSPAKLAQKLVCVACMCVCLCECIYVCAKHERDPGFYCPPLPSTDPYAPPQSSLLFSLSISGLINNSLHSPWCLVTFPSHSPPWLPPLTSPVLSSV